KKKLKEGQEVRRVAQLEWNIIKSDIEEPFTLIRPTVCSFASTCSDSVILGCFDFTFSPIYFLNNCLYAHTGDACFASAVILKTGAGQLDLLILDTLYKTGSHNTHFCLPQTLDAVKRLCPKRALLIGMTHEFDHHKDNQALTEWSRREGIPVELAYDGLRIPIDLKGGILLIDMYSDASGQNSR
ncbi:hypothetical protein IFM89_015155, partial [Coptis chinensis]